MGSDFLLETNWMALRVSPYPTIPLKYSGFIENNAGIEHPGVHLLLPHGGFLTSWLARCAALTMAAAAFRSALHAGMAT
jgi:hypothetical protein